MWEIVISDDEDSDLRYLSDMLADVIKDICVQYNLTRYNNPLDLVKYNGKIDVAFLDISMENMNGLELGNEIKKKNPFVKLIYTTSYEEYCLKAINYVHAYAYLCKPIDMNELKYHLTALYKECKTDYIELITFNKVIDKNGYEIGSIDLVIDDIVYFDYVKSKRKILIVYKDNIYRISYVMEKLIEQLKGKHFSVNTRGQLVNLKHVEGIKGENVFMDNGDTLYLAQKRGSHFKRDLNEFMHSLHK